MPTRRSLAAATAALFAPRVLRAQPAVEITVHVPQPVIFRASFDAIAAAFARREPDIRLNWVTTPNYEEGLQLLLRQAATNSFTVDLSYQGFNRLRVLAERGIVQDLRPLLEREGDPAAQGYAPNLLALAHFGGIQAGLAYAASNPITFLNADLVRRAGTDPAALPRDWDGIIALAQRIRELGADGMFYSIGNEDWMFSALLFGHGGRMLSEDEREVLVNGPEGLAALRLIERFMREARMPLLTSDAATQAFAAGRLGLVYRSTAFLRGMIQQVGRNFELQTAPMPVMDPVRGRLPTGGAAGALVARDPAKREAAWKFLRFSTSPEGTTLMVQNTGYVPMNQIAIDDPRWLAGFYRENPLFRAATEQVHLMVPWTPFPGPNSVRITQAVVDNVMRVVEGRASPEVALADMAAEMRRLLPRGRG